MYAAIVGAIGTGSLIALLVITIAFAANLTKSGLAVGGLAIASAVLCGFALVGMLFVVVRRFYLVRDGRGEKGRKWQFQKIPLAIGALLLVWSLMTIATFVWIQYTDNRDLPPTTLGTSSHYLLATGWALWGIFMVSQILYSKDIARRAKKEYDAEQAAANDEGGQPQPELADLSRPPTAPPEPSNEVSADLGSPESIISSRRRSVSDTMRSIRNSFTNVVRPITSKTGLVDHKTQSRAASLDSGTGEREIVEDGFDSWDTSAVETPAWKSVMESSNTNSSPPSTTSPHPRILETIPASPTTSRSPSPGYPLDLPPPNTYAHRSRSQSPASFRMMAQSERSRAASPAGSESHIHPLFRSDSPTPPPSATPTSIITAAPNAGQVLPDLSVVRRKRSGSLSVPSPLVYSTSFDNTALERRREGKAPVEDTEESEKWSEATTPAGERAMTPPIPDWILGAGQRTSMHGYAKRKIENGRGVRSGLIGGKE